MDKKITKLIEQESGIGKLYEGEEFLDSVKYSFSIHQEFIIAEDSSGITEIPSLKELSGSIGPENYKVDMLGKIYFLEIPDGRKFPIVLFSGNPVEGTYGFKRAAVS
ncbi:MAG: hypothetical protein Q8N39_07645 [Pelolinea sp.]|nr:hypothetical protein [Pelolinea sp.]